MWPEGADGKLCLHPALSDNSRHVPDRVPLRSTVHFHIDIQGSRARPITAGEVVMEVNAVSVVLLQGGQKKVGLLARGPPRAVHHHEGSWKTPKGGVERRRENENQSHHKHGGQRGGWR
jgi:hypothetical protein